MNTLELILLLFVIFQTRHAIVIAYLHRDLCHKSIVYSDAFSQFARILQWLGSSGRFRVQDAHDWAFTHKAHHAHTDTEEDPYWHLVKDGVDPETYDAPVVELTELDKKLEKYPYGFELTLIVSALLAGFWGVLFALAIRHTPRWRMIFANKAYHTWPGWRWKQEKPRDEARNLYYGFWFFVGEELHANHHRWPKRANFGVRWWEIDLSYWLLKTLSLFGLTKIRKPHSTVELTGLEYLSWRQFD